MSDEGLRGLAQVHMALSRDERYTYFGFARDEVLFVMSLADLAQVILFFPSTFTLHFHIW